MRTSEWIVLGIGIVVMLLISKIRRPKPAPLPPGSIVQVFGPRFSTAGVLAGLVKAGVCFAIYTAATLPLLLHPPAWLVEWWYAMFFVDLAAFCVCFRLGLPKAYIDSKSPDHHTPLDYLVGVVLTVVLIAGIGIHLVTIAQEPGFSL
ncbi:MAG: hypothetical protein KC996_06780 [Phycisphaerales bacterium]|nr:hypothetical protein [Phycisphaerales bacterium]